MAPITFSEAALGSQITVPTPRGNSVTLKIPAGTSTGRVFRVRGKGVRGKDGKNGDLLVTVNVAVPQNMTDEQRDALQTYADLVAGEDPRKDLSTLAGNPNG